jgi:hypothetical protein
LGLALGSQATATADILGRSFHPDVKRGRPLLVLYVPTADGLRRVSALCHSLLEGCHHHEVPRMQSRGICDLLGHAISVGSFLLQLEGQGDKSCR